jgi:hypothetical protein
VEVLLGDPDTRMTLRQAARQEAERWGWGSATNQLKEYYTRAVNPSKVPLLA